MKSVRYVDQRSEMTIKKNVSDGDQNTTPPGVSVVLCTYNGSKFVGMQIQSILQQTYKNIEIIICDDCSEDNTRDIIETFVSDHSNIRYYKNEKNLGFNKNFEQALKLSSNDYIAISDQDDIWSPNKIAALMDNIADNWLIFSNSQYMDDNNTLKERKLLSDWFEYNNQSYKSFLISNCVTGHTTLIRREFLSYCLPFPSKGFYDWWMGFVAAYHHKIVYLNDTLTYYRIHEQSVIRKQLSETRDSQALIEYKTVTTQLRSFQKYSHLRKEDRKFIYKLRKAYIARRKARSLKLFIILLFHRRKILPFSGLNNYDWSALLDRTCKVE